MVVVAEWRWHFLGKCVKPTSLPCTKKRRRSIGCNQKRNYCPHSKDLFRKRLLCFFVAACGETSFCLETLSGHGFRICFGPVGYFDMTLPLSAMWRRVQTCIVRTCSESEIETVLLRGEVLRCYGEKGPIRRTGLIARSSCGCIWLQEKKK
jgi:hypothetical protein